MNCSRYAWAFSYLCFGCLAVPSALDVEFVPRCCFLTTFKTLWNEGSQNT